MRASPRLVLVALATLAGSAKAQEPKPSAPLARYFPGDDLVVYAEFDGLDAHSAAWKKTAAYRLLNETPTGAMLESVAVGLLDRTFAGGPPGEKRPTGAEMTAPWRST